VEKMPFNNLKSQRVLVNASLASKLFSSGVILYGTMLECIDAAGNTEGEESLKNAADIAKLKEFIVTFKYTYTEGTPIETLKKFLQKTAPPIETLKKFLQKTAPVCEITAAMIGDDKETAASTINSIPINY